MANCAYRITKDGSNYGIAINVADTTSATNLTTNYGGYNLYVNGSANITSNLNVGGTISGNSFTPTSPVAIEYGGTGASTAASARINLGLGSAATRADSYFALSGHNHDTVYKKIQTAVNNPTASGNTITYVDTISQNTQGVITATRKTIPNASTTTTGLVTTGEQTFSGAKSFANSISFTSGYIFYWRDGTTDRGGIGFQSWSASTVSSQRMYFRENKISANGSTIYTYSEFYSLPIPINSVTDTNSYYKILTSKDAVTIAQGGTGSTTSADARTALGITPANIGAKATQTAVADPAYDGDSITFINTISQNAQGVISPHKASVRIATKESNGIVSITTQTFAGEKHFLNGLFSYKNIRIKENVNNSTAGIIGITNDTANTDDHRLRFYEYSYTTAGVRNDNGYEIYYMPAVATNRTTSAAYDVWTSKNFTIPLSIANGGTGATTSANARTNLGLGSAATHAHGDYVTLADTQYITGTKSFKGIGFYFRESINDKAMSYIYSANSTTSTSNHRIIFREYTYDANGAQVTYGTGSSIAYEYYTLPIATKTDGAYSYDIITTKNLSDATITSLGGTLTIAKGGTGATTTANARTNLNIRSTSLYSGTFSSGSTTLTDAMLYQTLLFVGRNSNSVRMTTMVPTALITTTSARYQCTDDASYITFYLTKNGNDVTMEYSSRSAASLYNVYGLN